MRKWMQAAMGRLRRAGYPVTEAVVAASLAWIVAAEVVGHPAPLFAPSVALVVLGEARGRRLRQSVEIVLGVAAGVLVADLVVQALGGGTVTVLIVLALTIGPMVAIGASSTPVVQAAVSALYLVVVATPENGVVPFRFVDALIGGAVAIAVSQLAVARKPLAPLVAEARRTFADLADVLGTVNRALEECDEATAQSALDRAHRMNGCAERLRTEVLAAGETLRLRIRRRRRLAQMAEVEATADQLDHVVGNIWVLARNAVTLTRLHTATPPELRRAIEALADAVRAAGESPATDLAGQDDPDRHAGRADDNALEAVRLAAELLGSGPALPLTMIIGQIRLTAVDLLRGVGQDDVPVLGRVDAALGLTPA
ncbi:FUSC family protein [Micromonosporaceae bacterium Da 78-11]